MHKVTQLYLYPVKSLSGIAVQKAETTNRGFQYDRRWMVVDEEGRFISQREQPKMAAVKTAIKKQHIHLFTSDDPTGITIPLEPKDIRSTRKVMVWRSTCDAVDGFYQANDWLSTHLSVKCSLIYMPDQTRRIVDSDLVPENTVVSFADGYPYLVVGTASLADLNERLKEPVGITRFRPNIVVDTNIPFEEDNWTSFQLGKANFEGVKPCSRCIMVNVDPEAAVITKQPLRTLARYRMEDTKIKFGLNALWTGGANEVSVGEALSKEIK